VKQHTNIYKLFFSALLFVIAVSFNVNVLAQEKEKAPLNKKIKNIKGDVTKIVVTADGKETVFQGEEAQKLFKKLKPEAKKRVKVIMLDDDDDISCIDDDKVFFFKGDDNKDVKIFMKKLDEDFDWTDKGDKKVKKEINVEVKDGKKKVTITTTEDGEKKVDVLEGEAAEKFLKEHEAKGEHKMMFKNKEGKEIKIFKKKIEKE